VAKFVGVFVRLAVVGVAAAAAVGTVTAASSREPVPVNRVPVMIPSEGVDITNVMVLLPPTGAGPFISAARAVALAQRTVSAKIWQHAVTTRATIAGPLAVAPDRAHTGWATLHNAPAWVVTFTATRPQHVGFSPGALSKVKHMSVVLDARDGRFVRGFYTA
jgi:hypothetical protein